MLARIYRQRRRILFGSTLLVLALLIADRTQPGGLSLLDTLAPTSRLMLVTTILGVFAVVSALIVTLTPGARTVIEVTALSALAQTTLTFLLPDPLVQVMWGTGYTTILLFVLYVSIYMVLYGGASDLLRLQFSARTRHVFRVPESPETVWQRMVPEPGSESRHWSGKLRLVEPDPEESDTLHAEFALGGGVRERQAITFLDREPPYHCVYFFISDLGGSASNISEGACETRITPLPDGGCEVETALSRNAMPLGMAMLMWFDDSAGEQADMIRAGLGALADPTPKRQARRAAREAAHLG